MSPGPDWRGAAAALLARHRARVLMTLRSGAALGLADGFVPRLVAYTVEDKAAKGLRSLKDRAAMPEPPIHYSVLEVVQDSRCTLLLAPEGGGKTTLALHLALNLAGDLINDAAFNRRAWAAIARNELGDRRVEAWTQGATMPAYVVAQAGMNATDACIAGGPEFQALLSSDADGMPAALLIVDEIERLGAGWSVFASGAVELATRHRRLFVLLLGETDVVKPWPLPAALTRHELLPLLAVERRAFRRKILDGIDGAPGSAALSDAAALPALFALAQRIDAPATSAEEIVDAWSATAPAAEWERATANRGVRDLLAARDLAAAAAETVAAFFADDCAGRRSIVASVLRRLRMQPELFSSLARALIALPGDIGLSGALLAAAAVDPPASQPESVKAALLRIVEEGRLGAADRALAGRLLAILGDPRDLERLVDVPGGRFTMGSRTHPNSEPPHAVFVEGFRIGAYPVTNSEYRTFIAETGRTWVSQDGLRPERANAPAVDLTWHDARAYCAWLTRRWRDAGRIGASETIRLPTEPEWERAARGDRADAGDDVVYPWVGGWRDDATNAETTGFNDTCPVGLFPAGRSPYGCYDMAGQVWEWCSTLWGEDMARPSFAYPYREDGREASDAPDAVRRVLRGGCFSSGPAKACATYRGSLEANGFWRGNGFRIVVAPSSEALR